ncbi:Co2+/Mg2+ efflux protein ApaG [Martelella endophytica]|uniref:Protein ApaG n=1 Tax=Martelella endophytica TaxID=1486262 RepID=A0A0D5LRB1_MAREN|nr:Co2+/Mg2+ efflux protein ApaG [Martelella endophytica]AJY46312.1 hypothetical protein TM49_12525 [Martelella endophytica]
METAVTHGIEVRAEAFFLEERSNPDEDEFVWSYHIEIINHGSHPVRLVSRHWTITNADGASEIVEGSGVVGKQPLLESGGQFEYSSAAPLDTPSGIMVGHYMIERGAEELLQVTIPPMSLDSPYEDRAYH